MPGRYLIYEDSFQDIPWTYNDFKTAAIAAREFKEEGKNPQIYQLIYANGEMQISERSAGLC